VRDERLVVGFVALHVLVAAPGLALLYALGLVRAKPAPLLAALGPGFLVGVVVVGLPMIVLLVAGVAVTTFLSLALLGVVTLALAFAAMRAHRNRRREPASGDDRPPRLETAVERIVLLGLALYLAVGSVAFAHLPTAWDDANIWSLRGLALYHHDGLVPEIFSNPTLTFVHLDYPILQPVLEASFFRAIGAIDLRLWHLELWVVLTAAIWTMAWLLAPLGRRWLWVIVLGVLTLANVVTANVTVGYADVTMAALLGCGTLAFGIWLDGGHRAHAILGALFVAGAANVKNEGLAFGVAVLVSLTAVVVARRRARWRDLALSVAIFVAAVLPWLIYVAANEAAVRPIPSPWEFVDNPGYLGDRISFLWRGVEQVLLQFSSTATWSFLVPGFVVAAVVLISVGRHRSVAAFYLGAWLLASCSVAYTYWVTPIADLEAFEQRSGPRIVLGAVFIAGAGLAHLLQRATAAATAADVDPLLAEQRDRRVAEPQA
jgi:hypothetical protein